MFYNIVLGACCQGMESAEETDMGYEPHTKNVYKILAGTAWL